MVNSMKFFLLVFGLTLFSICGMAQSKPQRDMSKDRKTAVAMSPVSSVPGIRHSVVKENQLVTNNKPKRIVAQRKLAYSNKRKRTNIRSRRIEKKEKKLTVSSTYVAFNARKCTMSVDVNANGDFWYLTDVPNWCRVSCYSGFFTITCEDNRVTSSKDAAFYVHSSNQEVRISVHQSGAPEVSASISNVSIVHNENIENEKCMVISGVVGVPVSYNRNFFVEAFFYDTQNNCIDAHWAYPEYKWHSTDLLCLKSASFTATPNQLYYDFRMVLPNRAIAVPKGEAVLTCMLNVYNSEDETLVCNSSCSFKIKLKRKKEKTKTMDFL